FNISVNAGEYAWKPVIFCDILNEFKGLVCWMDAGNLVTEPLTMVRRITTKIGMYSPSSSGIISEWTHPGTLACLNVPDALLSQRNLAGSCVAVSYCNPIAREIANEWKECALTRGCIAPIGSSRKNHRQDQAVLTIIAHKSGITKHMPSRCYGFVCHQDID